MQIYLIRHGETEWNTKRLLQGTTDIPLNENGIALAKETAAGMRDIPIDMIITSPLKRARMTAEIIRGDRDIPVAEDARIREICFGKFEGFCCSREGYNIPDPDFTKFFTAPADYVPPEGGESILQLCERTTEFLRELAGSPAYQEKTVLVSTHGAAMKGLLSSITITDMKDFWGRGVHRNCGVTLLEAAGGTITLKWEDKIYYDEAKGINYYVR